MASYIVYYQQETLLPSEALLNIPVVDVSQYSTRPLKWIRFVMAAILGSQGGLVPYPEDENDDENDNEGHGDNAINLEDPAPQIRKLLFIPQGPIHFIDVDGLNHLTSSQTSTPSRAGFRANIVGRDMGGVIRQVTADVCHACHLIPHSKGNTYMQALCLWRTTKEEPEIEDINDVQNGILLDPLTHGYFDQSWLAILPTPNFALDVHEVLPNPTYEGQTPRFTPHFFIPNPSDDDRLLMNVLQQDLRYPIEIVDGWPRDWPPYFLWESIYGILIVKNYGSENAVDIARAASRDHLYPGGIQSATQQAKANLERTKQENKRKNEAQDRARDERAARRGGAQDELSYSDAFDIVFCLRMQSRFGRSGQEARARQVAERTKREQEELRATSERVDEWRREVVDSVD